MFTPDAYIDYRVTGGIDGRFPEVKAWLKEVLPNFPAYYHMLGNVDVRIERRHRDLAGDLLQPDGDGWRQGQIYFVRHLVRRRVRQDREGWRMSSRVEEKCFDKLL